VIGLLRAMRRDFRMAIALISHDLGVVAGLADRILVMYAGRIVENALAAELFRAPRHPYTAELLRCAPSLGGPPLLRLPSLAGQPPNPAEIIQGCAFAPRCPRASALCRSELPLLRGAGAAGDAAQAACHHPLAP
jgi:oligopeptide/dipeptide ABC transporter ATP-binding protein